MGFVKKTLFGESPKTSTTDTMRPETDYEKKMREQLTPMFSDMATKGQPFITGAMDNQAKYASGVLPDAVAQNIKTNVGNMMDATVGSSLNDLSKRGVINSTTGESAMNGISQAGANAYNQNYLSALGQMSDLNGQQYQMGQGMLQPATGLYTSWLQSRSANPMTVTQTQGSGGLFGGFASGVGGALGKKWFG